jgi:hypothetical protein
MSGTLIIAFSLKHLRPQLAKDPANLIQEDYPMAARKTGIPRDRTSAPKPRAYKPREPRPARSPRTSQAEQKPHQPKPAR